MTAPRPHRPARFADLTEMIDAGGGFSPSDHAEVAAATAQLVVRAGRSPGDREQFVALADEVGLDTLASLWRDCDPASLPGVLWTLYLLRQWCRDSATDVVRLWRRGEPLAPAEAAVAGVGEFADAEAVGAFGDVVLAGVYRGDLDVALERAAAFFRVVATGRRDLLGSTEPDPATDAATLAERNDRTAAALAGAARQWRAGTLH
ncbi:hypothetical protein [uncultured Jatrophihabitans sp.]|uniref:hypothetical protein n=1 Tax=uncultured Jatrophihabitans sp. TaxID=1610747 RepID=UPI0035C9C2A9